MTKRSREWFPFYIDEFCGSPAVRAMDPAARAGYVYLLARQWESPDCSLSSDPMDLAESAGMDDEMWALYGPCILRNFVSCGNSRIRNESLYEKWARG